MDTEALETCRRQVKQRFHVGTQMARTIFPIITKTFLLEQFLVARFLGANVWGPRTKDD